LVSGDAVSRLITTTQPARTLFKGDHSGAGCAGGGIDLGTGSFKEEERRGRPPPFARRRVVAGLRRIVGRLHRTGIAYGECASSPVAMGCIPVNARLNARHCPAGG
jgi:hypothetical protein